MIVELSGGLGNQMFEYAAARYVQLQNNDQMYFNLAAFARDSQREYALGHYRLDSKVKKLGKVFGNLNYFKSQYYCHIYHRINKTRGEEAFKYLAGKKLLLTFDVYKHYQINADTKGYYWKGCFQSEKYFPGIKSVLKKDFEVVEDMSDAEKCFADELKKNNSVCVHIRRGDYVTNPIDKETLDICHKDYYLKGIDYLKRKLENPVFYVFSNSTEDLEWISKNYELPEDVKYVNMNNTDYKELWFMCKCKHFIISNSTFSWWAQYLSDNDNRIVVAPDKWYRGGDQDPSDIYQDDWYLVEV